MSQAYQDHKLVDDQHLQAIGSALWEALQLGDALEKAKQASDQHVFPIIIESADAAILTLPWETLYHPQFEFLGRSSAFTPSRRNPGLSIKLPEIQQQPLRVLLFSSLPDDIKYLTIINLTFCWSFFSSSAFHQQLHSSLCAC